jgi:hypothetical protein
MFSMREYFWGTSPRSTENSMPSWMRSAMLSSLRPTLGKGKVSWQTRSGSFVGIRSAKHCQNKRVVDMEVAKCNRHSTFEMSKRRLYFSNII